MGNCATKPKVLKDTEEDLVPVERDTAAAPTENNKGSAEKSENNAPNAADVAAAAASRRSEKGKEILVEEDVKEEHSKRPSLSPLFHEDKVIGKEVTNIAPTKPETNDKTGASSDASKLDVASPMMASDVKAPETFDVKTRDDLEVKIPKDSVVKTPETPKAEEQQVHFSENWEVKFPEELETDKTSGVVKVKEESNPPQVSKVSAPELPDVKVTKESDVPKVLEDKNVKEVSEVPARPELSEVKVTKESDVPKVFEDKKVPEGSEVHALPELSDIKVTKEPNVPEVLQDKNVLKTDEVKSAESELLKVSEVKSSEDLEVKVPKVFEVKTPGTSNVKVESEVKSGQEASKANIVDETEVPEFLDAQEKIDKAEAQILDDIKVTEDKEIAMSKKEEGKGLSTEKKVKEATLSGLDSK